MKQIILNALALILGRRSLWRFGRSMYLKARADVANSIHSNGEELALRQMLGACSSNTEIAVVFDVGANIGTWTVLVLQASTELKMNDRLQVHCFEPVPSTFRTLQDRICKHPIAPCVHLRPEALSSSEGVTEMFVDDDHSTVNSLHADPSKTGRHRTRIQIKTTTADAYCRENDIPRIDYLKCDAEGHDIEVLYGAKQMFQEERVMVAQFEYNHRWVFSRHYLLDAFEFAKNIRYSIGKITPTGIEIYYEWHPELERFFEGNYLLIHDKALSWFSARTGRFDSYNTYDA